MRKLFFLCLIVVLVKLNCSKKDESPKKTNLLDFTLKSIDNNEYTLNQLKGNVIIIDFWATWCRPCILSIPIFNELYEKYKDKGVLILGIGLDEERAIRQFVERHKISYPVLIGTSEVSRKYGIRAIPTTYVIDKKGKVAARHVGFMPNLKNILEQEIKKLL
jgi:peroxiredoxin